MIDPYKTLGVDKAASPDVIKKAYRNLAKEYHPDKQKGNEEKFKEVADAYDTLNNPQKKARYDQQRHNPFGGGFSEGFSESMFEDSLEHLIKGMVIVHKAKIHKADYKYH